MNMKRTEKAIELSTSERVRGAGLKRIPRRHLLQPGEITLSDCKVRVTMYLDADIIEYFKMRAAQPNAAPYQTQINNELRNIMERGRQAQHTSYDYLVNDERFIEAVAARIRKGGKHKRK